MANLQIYYHKTSFQSHAKGYHLLVVCLILLLSSITSQATSTTSGITTVVTTTPPIDNPPSNNTTLPASPQSTGNNSVGSATTSSGGSLIKVNLNEICEQNENCPDNSVCAESDLMDGQIRCMCQDGYGVYEETGGYKCGEKIKDPTNEFCSNCTENQGQCIKSPTDVLCTCPSSRSGKQCELLHARVSCEMNQLRVCYTPHENVDLEKDWAMYSQESIETPKCNGLINTNNINDTFCKSTEYLVSLSLDLKDYEDCKTKKSVDSRSQHFINQIHISSTNNSKRPYVFNVYCSFQRFSKQQFNGVGVLWPNGNDQGQTVNARLSLSIKNQFGNPLPDGSSILAGNKIKYEVVLTTDDNYKSFQVIRCTASSSFIMPDTFAQTRALISNGCPLKDEATKDSWYWQGGKVDDKYILSTGAVPMFKLSSSEFVHLHCAIKLCLNGFDESCPVLTPENCKNSRRKRDVGERYKRQAQSDSPGVFLTSFTSSLRVIDNTSPIRTDSSSGGVGATSGSTMFAVIFSVLIAVVIVGVVLGTVFASRLRNKQQQHPERFAMPRIQNKSHKF